MKEKLLSVFVVLMFLLIAVPAKAQNEGFGIGVMAGEPSGVNAKYWLSSAFAVDGGVGYAFIDEGGLQVHADFLYHLFEITSVRSGRLPVYIGAGGRIKFQDDNKFGIRFPVGLAYAFENDPIDVFLEAAPVLDLAPDADLGFNGVIGARYYF